jgi:hypothetical protein
MMIHKKLVFSFLFLSLSFVACNKPESQKAKDNPPQSREDESLSDEERKHVSIASRDSDSSFKNALATYKSSCHFNDFYGKDGEWPYLIVTLSDFGSGFLSLENTFYAEEECKGIYNSMSTYYSFPFLKSPFHAIEEPHVIDSFVLEHPSQVYAVLRTNDDSYIEDVNEDEDSFLIKNNCGPLESGKDLFLKKDCLKDGFNEEAFLKDSIRDAKTTFKLGFSVSYDKDKKTVIITSHETGRQMHLEREEHKSHE